MSNNPTDQHMTHNQAPGPFTARERRGINLDALDPEDYDTLATTFGVAHQLIQEIEYMNDEANDYYGNATPEQRWQRMHDWAMGQLRPVRTST